ncbi:MAG: type VI secretion system tube protein Hcp [Planctomycetes bacterium]|nr:type VI secretion system tube protein Hcp [Planctomycetota bacterium]
MPIFMKAGSIEGDVAAGEHRGWVLVDSCGYSVELDEKQVRLSKKSEDDGELMQAEQGEFEVVKPAIDRAGPKLMTWMLTGDQLDVQFDVCGGDTVADGKWRKHMTYRLEAVKLISYSMNMADAEKGRATITMKLQYEKLTVEHYSYGKDNPTEWRKTVSKTVSCK